MTDFDAEVGKRVRELREKFRYSREKLSEMADISPKFLYEIEMGRKGMSAYTLRSISKALGVSADYFLSESAKSGRLDYIMSCLSVMDNEQISHIENIISHIYAMVRGDE